MLQCSLIFSEDQSSNSSAIDDETKACDVTQPIKVSKPPKLVADHAPVTISDHTQFWSTYDRVASALDRELINAWNDSLDVLLIFAGLFSAINTAFIIESYKGLQPDPAEITNDLLRILISHRSDNITLSPEELRPGSPTSSAVPINSIFFSSLSFSLTAAFGAVTAKQWLTEYTNIGTMKALHVQGTVRQEKYRGLKTWHLRLIIELLPMFLQLSLLLFLIGVVEFLWEWNQKVSIVQLVLSCTGLAVYCGTIIIGIMIPSSPFQTPLSRYVRLYSGKIWRGLTTAAQKPGVSARVEYLRNFLHRVLPGVETLHKAATDFIIHMPNARGLNPRTWFRQNSIDSPPEDSGQVLISDSIVRANPKNERCKWSPSIVTAAEAVVWLLEHAEHLDVTITALDAVRRLPPSLIFYLIREREGLMERMIAFHHGLLPLSSSTTTLTKWLEGWSEAAVVSSLAWHHIMWAIPFGCDDLAIRLHLPGFYNQDYLSQIPNSDSGVLLDAKRMLNFHLSQFSAFCDWELLISCMKNATGSSAETLRIKFTDPSRAASMNDHFVTSFSPLHLVLDSAISLSAQHSDIPSSPDSPFPIFISLLHGELPHNTVSHVAIAVAAMHSNSEIPHEFHDINGGISATRLRRSVNTPPRTDIMKEVHIRINRLKAGLHTPDRWSTLLENVVFAFSTICYAKDETLPVFKAFLEITGELFCERFTYPSNPIPYEDFPQNLVQLARFAPEDAEIQILIAKLLCRCSNGRWITLLHEDSGQDIQTLLLSIPKHKAHHSHYGNENVLGDLFKRIQEAPQLLDTFRSFTSLRDYFVDRVRENPLSPSISRNAASFQALMTLYDRRDPDHSYLLQTQISYLIMVLIPNDMDYVRLVNMLLHFLEQLLSRDARLQRPSYLHIGVQKEASFNPQNITTVTYARNRRRLWRGEASLLLWSKAKKAREESDLPNEWESSLFFNTNVANLMVTYWEAAEQLKEQQHAKYSGIDYMVLKEYLESALREWGANDEEPERKNITFQKMQKILQELDSTSNKPTSSHAMERTEIDHASHSEYQGTRLH
ncbi:hypothetical protein FRC02_002734 [Tulasnella sp. 418]|nr:hypothetical protein FRC02_002734 [Tulasnella sp. 418]